MEVDLRRRADLLQDALVHDGDPVGERHRLDLVVGDVDRGRAVLDVQPLQFGAHVLAQLGVERADRLVHQQRLRPAHQRPADRDALHVAARQRRRPSVEQMLDAAAPARPRAPRASIVAPALAGRRAAERRCSRRRSGADRARRAGRRRRCRGRRRCRSCTGLPSIRMSPASIVLEPGDGAQRRRLAAARRAEQHDEFLVARS